MFFNWLTKNKPLQNEGFDDFSLINAVEFLTESSAFITKNDIAILFAADHDFLDLRKELFAYANHFNIRIIELGQLKKSNSQFHLQFFKEILKNNKLIFIGETAEYELSIDLALKSMDENARKVNISKVLRAPCGSECTIGYQRHVSDIEAVKQTATFAKMSLGELSSNIEKAEPIIRDSQYVILNNNALNGDVVNNGNNLGMSTFQACHLAKYAGHNGDIKTFHIALDDLEPDSRSVKNIATMIWYFLEGLDNCQSEYAMDPDNQQYLVQSDYFNQPIVFIKSLKTGRWWIKHQEKQEKYIPCDIEDYEECRDGNLPEKFISLIK